LPSIHGPRIAPMPPPDGWRLDAGLYSPGIQQDQARPRASKMHPGQNKDDTLEGLGTERRLQPEFGLLALS